MNRNVLRQVLMDQQEFLKRNADLIDRDLDLTPFLEGREIVVISGIRRCGKSSLLRLISDRIDNDPVLINFDDIRFVDFSTGDYQMIEEIVSELIGKDVTFLLDEVQNVDGWHRWVNNLFERGYKVYVTGSNSNLLSSEISTYLTGRNRVIDLSTFSFREKLKLEENLPESSRDLSTVERGAVIKSFMQYLGSGGFPEVLISGDLTLSRLYFNDILIKDIAVRNGIREVKELKDLSLFCITNSTSQLSYSTLRSITGLKSLSTIKNYLEYLRGSYLIDLVHRFSYSIKKQKSVPSKVYAGDIGFLKSVALNFSENRGRRLENFVYTVLKGNYDEIYFHLEKRECDFVIKEGLKIAFAIQVTESLSNPQTRKKEIDGLLDAMRSYGLVRGLIITFDEEDILTEDGLRIDVAPAWKWALDNGPLE
ncbi:MAG: ATP-binding protein [Thermoplasmata archaeon]|nr:ATP-binding protein [Thermoplasmata archaeon]